MVQLRKLVYVERWEGGIPTSKKSNVANPHAILQADDERQAYHVDGSRRPSNDHRDSVKRAESARPRMRSPVPDWESKMYVRVPSPWSLRYRPFQMFRGQAILVCLED